MESSKWGEITGSSPCRACKAQMWWVLTRSGKKMPVDADDVCHFETCPGADEFRKTPTEPPAPAEPQISGVVELDDSSDPTWYVVRMDTPSLKIGDTISVTIRSKGK